MIAPCLKTLLTAAVVATLAAPAMAQTEGAAAWVLSPDTGYGYTRDGKMLSYKMGTSNAKDLFKGAKRVPKETLFFVGANGQLYMRAGPFVEENGTFKFGSNR
ncbi:hypothetical protein LPW26_18250 [Rhodopseudomonas sp. HC1]|uniref:hypothetical protein n=1 Tax=Rhodopseudomonas infernalis TaxID=2897386 RepID=UPI001EE981F5|nr:hypothetical protein [Rhodopseudomonas infernalis]MCG6206594.1 hypothetical protein [Rhodopseudomonas infernalis]